MTSKGFILGCWTLVVVGVAAMALALVACGQPARADDGGELKWHTIDAGEGTHPWIQVACWHNVIIFASPAHGTVAVMKKSDAIYLTDDFPC